MARYITSVESRRTVEEAFAFMADMTRFPEWDPGVERAVRVAGTGTGVGTAYDVTVNAGARSVMRYEVQECEAPRRILLVSRTPWLTSEDEIRVEPRGHGSRVTYDAKLTLRRPLGLLNPLLGIALNRIGDRAASGLRRVLQAAT